MPIKQQWMAMWSSSKSWESSSPCKNWRGWKAVRLVWVSRKKKLVPGCLSEWAAKKGELELLKWFHDRKLTISKAAMNIAVYHGQTEVCQWLLTKAHKRISRKVFHNASLRGHNELVRFIDSIQDKKPSGCKRRPMLWQPWLVAQEKCHIREWHNLNLSFKKFCSPLAIGSHKTKLHTPCDCCNIFNVFSWFIFVKFFWEIGQ